MRQLAEIGHFLKLRQPRVGNFRVIEGQHLKLLDLFDVFQPRVGDLIIAQVHPKQMIHFEEMRRPFVRDARAAQVHALQLGQLFQLAGFPASDTQVSAT